MGVEYKFMDKAVDELVEAMAKNPGRFTIGTYTLDDRKTGIEYWTSDRGSIVAVVQANGRSHARVFSDEQGRRLWEAYQKLRETKASQAQMLVLRSIEAKEEDEPKSSGTLMLVLAMAVVLLLIGIFRVFAS